MAPRPGDVQWEVAAEGAQRTRVLLHSATPPSPPLPTDKQSLRSEPSVIIVSCKDGRQLLSIPRAGKRHAGLYECSATNVLGSITSSCTVAVARESRAGTQEVVMRVVGQGSMGCRGSLGFHFSYQVPQESWLLPRCPRPTRTRHWCSGSRETARHLAHTRWSGGWMVRDWQAGQGWGAGGGRRSWGDVPSLSSSQMAPGAWATSSCGLSPCLMLPAGESSWHPVSSGIPDCYYNVTHLPVGVTVRFRVACANRAGQGPFSNPSEKVLVRGVQGQWDRAGVAREGRVTGPRARPLLGAPGFAPEAPW